MTRRIRSRTLLTWLDAWMAAAAHAFINGWTIVERAYTRPFSRLALRMRFAFYPLLALGAVAWLVFDWTGARSLASAEDAVFDNVIKSRPGITSGEQELHLVGVIRRGKFLHVIDQAGQRLGLVVGEVGVQGQQAAVFVVQPARRAGGDHVEHRLVVLQLVPLRVALTEADQHAPVEQRQRVGRIHARQGAQLPVQGIDFGEDVVARTAAGRCFYHHREQVAAGAVMTGQKGIVLVVA